MDEVACDQAHGDEELSTCLTKYHPVLVGWDETGMWRVSVSMVQLKLLIEIGDSQVLVRHLAPEASHNPPLRPEAAG